MDKTERVIDPRSDSVVVLSYGTHHGCGVDELLGRPRCKDGRIVATDVVRLEKGHIEGLEPSVTEHLVLLIVSVKGGDTRKQFQ